MKKGLGEAISASDEQFTVQQATELTGLSEHTLRYYERVGLLQSVRRHGSSGHRRYSAMDIAKLETLACLRAAGMSLDHMRRYFELLPQGVDAAPQIKELLEAQQQVLEERLKQMQGYLNYINQKIAYWHAIEAHDNQAAADIARKLSERIPTCTHSSCDPIPDSELTQLRPAIRKVKQAASSNLKKR
ncbi:MAG: MerR family transcriptional regulator [Acidobacteriota bacterium]